MLSAREKTRYDRQIMLPELGEAGQRRLKDARVTIVGAGGLGSPVAIYLAVAGVGTLQLIDRDTVELSNLNRQILHWEADLEREKVASAAAKLQRINTDVRIESAHTTLTAENAAELIAGSDLVVDALDNLPTRYLLNRAAVAGNIPLVHGAVAGFEGRALTVLPGKSACLRCLHREPAPPVKFPVVGVAPAVIGSIQATEALKCLAACGDLLTNRLLVYDGLRMTFREYKLRRNPQCPDCGHL